MGSISQVSFLLSLFYIVHHCDVSAFDFPTVRVSTALGDIEGSFLQTETGQQFPAFRGIRYGQAPIGDRRFKKPVPVEKWEGVLDATKDGPECAQKEAFSRWYIGEEDCLFLNVYTPQLPTSDVPANKPVMVWIHGGGFFFGSGKSDLYGPSKILNHDVVLVTINYRLAVFGFLTTGDEAAPGNYGLWDQIEALKWVQDNIRYFGGDPNRVTIFGESAGGFSTGALLVTPKAKGLFHRAISQSGSAACLTLENNETHKKNVEILSKATGCSTGSSQEMIDCLRQVPAADIVTSYSPAKYIAGNVYGGPLYPVMDGDMFTKTPLKYLRTGDFNKVPFIAGTTEDEGEFMFTVIYGGGPEITEELIKEGPLKPWLQLNGFTREPGMVDEMIKKYFTSDIESMDKDAKREALVNMLTDVFMTPCTYRTIKAVAKHDVPAYMYRLDHIAQHSVNNIVFQKNFTGVPHYDDMGFLFDMKVFGIPKFTGKDHDVQEKLIDFWTTFAKTGSPTEDNSWKALKPSEGYTKYYRFTKDAMDDTTISPHQKFYDAYAERVEL